MKKLLFLLSAIVASAATLPLYIETTTQTVVSPDAPTTRDGYGITDAAGGTPTDGAFSVGNGSAWVAESGDTAQISLGIQTATGGGQVGELASTTLDGAAVGAESSSTSGGAVGLIAETTSGGAVGEQSVSTSGGAVGLAAVTWTGGAVGLQAKSTNGFAGGDSAEANGSVSIQLGSGVNNVANTIQVINSGSVTAPQFGYLSTLTSAPLEPGDTQDYIQLNTTPPTPVYTAGRLHWKSDAKTLEVDTGVDDVAIQVGQELTTPLILNSSGLDITNGQVCRIDSSGNAQLAKGDARITTDGTIGLATHLIENTTTGFITISGLTRDVDTSLYAAGTVLYVSATVGGGYTDTAPDFPVRIGTVWTSHATTGSILVGIIDERILNTIPFFRDYSFTTQGIGTGTFWVGGFYESPVADSNLTQASITQAYGTAGVGYSAHAFLVAGGAGTATGGAGAVSIVVLGTSITDAGVRTTSDTEVIVADITTMSLNAYYETSKKWLGTVTYTLTVGATGHTAYAADFNYGIAKYEDLGNRNFTVHDFEAIGLSGGNDTGYSITLFHHEPSAWTYNATAFEPGSTIIADSETDLGGDDNLINNEYFSYKREALNTQILGNGEQGTIIRIKTTSNNSIEQLNIHVGATL